MLSELLPDSLFTFLLIFVRLGACLMFLPVMGEPFVSARIRLLFALLLTLIVQPAVAPLLPAMPADALELGILVLGEVLIGVFLGLLGRVFIAALTTAGMVIAYSSSLANALVDDPSAAQQGSIFGSFLTIVALLMIMALNLHHLFIQAAVDSYGLIAPGRTLPVEDFSRMMTEVVARSFLVAMKLSLPFIAASVIFYLGLGVLGRLMPQMQVFFVAIPLQIAIGLLVLTVSMAAVMQVFLGELELTYLPFALN